MRTRLFTSFVSLATLAAGLLSSPTAQAGWKIDAAHSSVNFAVQHMMVTKVRGEFTGITGTIDLDASKVDVSIDIASIDTRNKKRDDHLKSGDFFAADKHPKARFVASKFKKNGEKIEVVGKLTLRGVTKTVTLKGTVSPEFKNPWGQIVRGLQVTTTIKRDEYKISWNKSLDKGGLLVGNEVELEINIELTKT